MYFFPQQWNRFALLLNEHPLINQLNGHICNETLPVYCGLRLTVMVRYLKERAHHFSASRHAVVLNQCEILGADAQGVGECHFHAISFFSIFLFSLGFDTAAATTKFQSSSMFFLAYLPAWQQGNLEHANSCLLPYMCIQFRLEEHSTWSALQCLDKFCTETEQQFNLYTFFHFDPILKCFMSHLISYNNQTLSASFDPTLLHEAPRYTSECLSSNLVFHSQSVLLKVVILVRTGDFKRFMEANLNNIH